MGRHQQWREVLLRVSIDDGYRRASVIARVISSGRRSDHLIATRRLSDELPVEHAGDCLDLLAEALRVLQEHPGIDWAAGPPAPPGGGHGGRLVDQPPAST